MLYYLPLESVKSRYTEQLSQDWMPKALSIFNSGYKTIDPYPSGDIPLSDDIEVGVVCDAVSRSRYSMEQVSELIRLVNTGEIDSDSKIFLQDLTTPGIEAFLYVCSVFEVYPKIYAMCHANTFDQYDFTHSFSYWMSHSEKALIGWMTKNGGAIFCASTVHKEAMLKSQVECNIFVVGLPYSKGAVDKVLNGKFEDRKKRVAFTSRLDKEKNPLFMVNVANMFLALHHDWEWVVTSSKKVPTKDLSLQKAFHDLSKATNGRFSVLSDLTKKEYYSVLSESSIQFNCSDQDYVSWTLLEAVDAGCIPCYPNFRSFPEVFYSFHTGESFLYYHCDCKSAVDKLSEMVKKPFLQSRHIVNVCDLGRKYVSYILSRSPDQLEQYPSNIWSGSNSAFFEVLSDMVELRMKCE